MLLELFDNRMIGMLFKRLLDNKYWHAKGIKSVFLKTQITYLVHSLSHNIEPPYSFYPALTEIDDLRIQKYGEVHDIHSTLQ